MCGIVGLLVKNPALRQRLGEWATPMLVEMGSRGPESAGLAVFSEASPGGALRVSLHAPSWSYDWSVLDTAQKTRFGGALSKLGNHAILSVPEPLAEVQAWLDRDFADVTLLSAGHSIRLYKDVGHPGVVAERYGFASFAGTHVVAHTRMATESAVTPDRAHPFTAGQDFCLVHNGTISNPFLIRRKLEREGIAFKTNNDSEAACRFLEWRLREGDDLEAALGRGLDELDGFYTFLIGTRDKLALVRDSFACKPAIAAETADYVAIASEFRALAHLPDIGSARLFEPMPRQIHTWKVAA